MWFLACAQPDPLSGFDDDPILLDVDASERARPAISQPVARLTPDGDPLQDQGWVPVGAEYVVVDPSDSVRIRTRDRFTTTLLWLDRVDLSPVAALTTTGRTTPDLTPTEAFVRLDAGRVVTPVDFGPGVTRVEVETQDIWAEAWFPAGHIDEVYRAEDPELDEAGEPVRNSWARAEGNGIRILRPGTEVFDAPGGRVLARVAEGEDAGFFRDARELRTDGDDVLVHLESAGVTVVGWVHVDDRPQNLEGRGVGWGCSCCGGWGALTGPRVPAGTLLWLGVEGTLVGRAEADLPVVPDGDGGWVSVTTAFGTFDAWVLGEDIVHDPDARWEEL